MKRKLLRWVLQVSGSTWQTSTDRVFHNRIALGKKVACACVALNLQISRFEPSGADRNWFKVSCSGYGDEAISDSVQHQDPATSSSLLE